MSDAIASDPISYNFQKEEIQGMVSGLAKEKIHKTKTASNVKEFILSVNDDEDDDDKDDDGDDENEDEDGDEDLTLDKRDEDSDDAGGDEDSEDDEDEEDGNRDDDSDGADDDGLKTTGRVEDTKDTIVRLRDECVNMQVKLYGKVIGVPSTDNPDQIRKNHKYYSAMMAKKYAITRFQRVLTLISQGAEMGCSYTGLADLDGLSEVITETNKDPEVTEALDELIDKYPMFGKGSTPETRLVTAYGSAIAMFLFTKKVLKDDPSTPRQLKPTTISEARMQKARDLYNAAKK